MRDPLDILKQYWGYESFRSPQEEIIHSVMEKKDTLALLPTGGGKSICFQVPALAEEGMALVVSPLIALMKDQVERLNRLGIAAAFINSSQPKKVQDLKLQKAMDGAYKFLYLAPERIRSEMFRLRLPNMDINLLAVDEAHCISQWGYDFRPDYLQIHEIRKIKADVPIIALTASATPAVQKDIQEKLELEQVQVFEKSYHRDNLRYFVLAEENTTKRIEEIVSRTLGCGIIYARTRKRVETLANFLRDKGHSVAAYHGGMINSEREATQQAWIDNTHRIMVATNAFGMGIDKPDVRFVVHFNLPADLESYYQEAGRGGRDGKTALAISFDNPIDIAELERWNSEKYPSWEMLNKHYQALCEFYRVPSNSVEEQAHLLDIQAISKELNTSPMRLYSSLRILHREGLVFLAEDKDDFGYLQVLLSPSDVLQYKSQRPKQAELIDFVLRKLGGEAYQQEVRFLPHRWASELNADFEVINEKLKRLAKLGVVHYQAPRGHPAIRFLTPRHKLSKQTMRWDVYIFLQKRAKDRLAQMLEYVRSKDFCRSLALQQYFGEQSQKPCGKCDVCIGRNKAKLSDREYKIIQKSIISFIRSEPHPTYRDVILKSPKGNPTQREKVLRFLLDKKVVLVDELGTLSMPNQDSSGEKS